MVVAPRAVRVSLPWEVFSRTVSQANAAPIGSPFCLMR